MASTTTINDLNNDCLREVLLNIEVGERMELRKVCKQWCNVVDDCWREVREVRIMDPISIDEFSDFSDESDTHGEEVTGTHHDVIIRTSGQKLIKGVMKHCGDVIKNLMEFGEGKDSSCLPLAIKYCSNIEDLIASIRTKLDDKNAGQFLALNKKLRDLNLGIRFPNTRICFRQISTDHLESLCFYVMDCQNPSSLILIGQKLVVGRCSSSLRKVTVNYFDDELVKLIAQKITLERLKLLFHYCNGVTGSALNHILTLKNLRELSLLAADASDWKLERSPPPVTDDFFVALVENLPLLKKIEIENPLNVTNKGFKRLAALKKLKELKITDCPGITDECLFLFSGLEELNLKNCRIRDAGVIRLLEEAEILRKLNLANSLITNHTLIAADMATKKRENGIRLSLDITGTATGSIISTETSPLLEIIKNDDEDEDEDEEEYYDTDDYDDDDGDDDDEYYY